MSDDSQTLTFEQSVPAPPAHLYHAFTNGSALREWLCDVAIAAPRADGYLFLGWHTGYHAAGTFVDLVPPRRVAFTWRGRDEPGATQVTVTLTPQEGGTRLQLQHAGIGQGSGWAAAAREFEKGWQSGLENLVSVYTTGEDIRFTKRPMLGIMVGEFNEATAARLGVPVKQGIAVDDTVADMGAATAGLRSGDVIVAIAGQVVVDWSTLNNALSAHRAGDTVGVDFYRGASRQQVQMTLSGRPLPEIPATPAALAAVVETDYQRELGRLADFLAGVSDEEAGFKPAPDEWSVKEVLAHLIHGERGSQNWIGDIVGGYEAWYDDWGGNLPLRVEATVAAFPTVDDLMRQLRRLSQESVALLARLPESFVARKGSYWRVAYSMVDAPTHFQMHMEQMQAAVAAAREKAPA